MVKENGFAEVSKIADLVKYQDDAVVSRTLMRKKSGSVTVFAFSEGQELSEHSAPDDALVHLLEGEAEITVEGRPHKLQVGDMILMPADRPHSVKAIGRFKMVLTMIR